MGEKWPTRAKNAPLGMPSHASAKARRKDRSQHPVLTVRYVSGEIDRGSIKRAEAKLVELVVLLAKIAAEDDYKEAMAAKLHTTRESD